MPPKSRIVIDTDPGVDDVLALLLALSADPNDLEVVLISVTYGNVELHSCLRNVVALFHVLEMEMEWRKSKGLPEGYEALKMHKPIVAVGAEHSLEDEKLMADYFHGSDGLHGVHDEHPHLTPADTWKSLFKKEQATTASTNDAGSANVPTFSRFFTPSCQPAHEEILRVLRENPVGTITIVAVGPLTNLALAAAADPVAFSRAKEVVVMGGAVNVEGNVTPVAEFNTYADAVAAARVFALTSPVPASTMPRCALATKKLGPYPADVHSGHTAPAGVVTESATTGSSVSSHSSSLSPCLIKRLTLFPLDITTGHVLTRSALNEGLRGGVGGGSPLAVWANTFLTRTMDNIERLEGTGLEPALSLHDPLCVWYMILHDHPAWKSVVEDIRIETAGEWTRGMHVVDRRTRAKGKKAGGKGESDGSDIKNPRISGSDIDTSDTGAREAGTVAGGNVVNPHPEDPFQTVELDVVPGDTHSWLSANGGNRVNRMVESPGIELFPKDLMKRIFGYSLV